MLESIHEWEKTTRAFFRNEANLSPDQRIEHQLRILFTNARQVLENAKEEEEGAKYKYETARDTRMAAEQNLDAIEKHITKFLAEKEKQ